MTRKKNFQVRRIHNFTCYLLQSVLCTFVQPPFISVMLLCHKLKPSKWARFHVSFGLKMSTCSPTLNIEETQGAFGKQISERLSPSPPLQLIAGVQEAAWGCVCGHCLSCLSGAGSQTRTRSWFPPRTETESWCCRSNWSCWSGRGLGGGGGGGDGWSSTSTSRRCPVKGSLWKRSSCHLRCWLRWWDRGSSRPQTRWPGRCHPSSRFCSCCRWKSAGWSGWRGSSGRHGSPSRGWGCCHSNYLETQQSSS